MNRPPVRVGFDRDAVSDAAIEDVVRRVRIPLVRDAGACEWVLTMAGDALVLRDRREPRLKPLLVDLLGIRRRFRTLPIAKRGPFAQALGRGTRTVIDATAGWGQDAILAWMMGYRVVAVERSPVVAALLLDGLRRFKQGERATVYPEIVVADARDYLGQHDADCVYLDPMFPPKGKSDALAKRPLRALRELVGDDADRAELFDCAWQAARRRVVVKRPVHAKAWRSRALTFGGKLMCYDVYLKQ